MTRGMATSPQLRGRPAAESGTGGVDPGARRLAWWMRLVGGLYLLLGVGFLPAINEARFDLFLPSFDAPRDSVAFMALIDWTWVFGIETAVIGAMLLWAARRPAANTVLVWTVVALELTRGLGWDLYYLALGYTDAGFYLGFIRLHVLIAGTGIALARRLAGAVIITTSLIVQVAAWLPDQQVFLADQPADQLAGRVGLAQWLPRPSRASLPAARCGRSAPLRRPRSRG